MSIIVCWKFRWSLIIIEIVTIIFSSYSYVKYQRIFCFLILIFGLVWCFCLVHSSWFGSRTRVFFGSTILQNKQIVAPEWQIPNFITTNYSIFNPDSLGSKNITIHYPGAIFGTFIINQLPWSLFWQFWYLIVHWFKFKKLAILYPGAFFGTF